MKTFQQKTIIQDARSKIRPKLTDARTKLLDKAKVKQFQSVANLTKKKFDARQNIKVKNVKQGRLKPPPVVIKKEVKVERTFPVTVAGPSTSLTSRTIKNPDVVKREKKEIDVENYSFKNVKDWDSFVCVSNGNRVLTERVTMEGIGMKIAVRNDCIKKPINIPKKKNPSLPLNKKQITTQPNSDTPIQITTPNLAVIAKLKKKKVQLAKKKKRAANLLKASQSNLQRRQQNKRKITETIHEPTFASPTPALKTVRFSASPQHVVNQYSDNQASMSGFVKNRQHNLVQNGIRPMISSESNDFRQPTSSVSHHQYSPQQQGLESNITSPLEGTKIYVSNLHPVVVEDDIMELFSVLGPLRRARMVGLGTAEVVFIRQDDAVKAYHKYNNRDLDGQPMHMKLLLQDRKAHNVEYTWMSEIGTRPSKSSEIREIEPATLQRALFKGGSTGSSSRPVVFTVKI